MNRFFNYDSPGAAEIYDKSRHAMGADVIAGLLHVHCGKPLKDIHVLDAGCGSGNFSKALIDLGVGKVSLQDANSEMLKVAKKKLSDAIDKKIVDVVIQKTLPELPYDSSKFDAVMFNAVLHQLDIGNNNGVPLLEKTLHDAKRILRSKGALVITTQLPTYVRDAIWYMQIQPEVTEKMTKTLMPAKQYIALFKKHGYKCVSAMNFLSATKTIFVHYHDPEGPLNEEWRVGTNEFGLADGREIDDMEEKLLALKEKGKLRDFVEEHDKTLEMGISTLFVCVPV